MSLATRYLGLDLRNPLIASASPLNLDLGNIRALEDCGAAAVVLPSVFQEQIELEAEASERMMGIGADSFPEARGYFPAVGDYAIGPERYLATIEKARKAVDIPIIASLNGTTPTGWTSYAQEAEEAGASAIELNIFFIPADPSRSSAQVEADYLAILTAVRDAVSIPIAVKLSPYFSATGHMVRQLADAGADGVVLFNRFYQPDIALPELRLKRDLNLSTPAEIRLPLLWIGALAGRVDASLAASSGVETSDEVVKYVLAGADAVMTTSSLLRHGLGHMRTLVDGLRDWMDARGTTVAQMRGRMSQLRVADPTAYERANYIRILQEWKA